MNALHATLCHTMRQLISRLHVCNRSSAMFEREKVEHPLASTVFFCGSSVHTRKDALYLTALHRLLVECVLNAHAHAANAAAETATTADVSLVTYYELWGMGDVLAPETRVFDRQHGVTWLPLSPSSLHTNQSQGEAQGMAGARTRQDTPPSTKETAQRVQSQLRVWFQRIDDAAAVWPQSSSPSPSALPLTAADKLHYLDSNAVVCTLRFRGVAARLSCSSSASGVHPRSDGGVAYLSLVLLPENSVSLSSSTHRGSAALWREVEALSEFMQSLPDAVPPALHRHSCHEMKSFAATSRATLRAAAVRRSRWLTTLAQLQSSTNSDATAAAQLRFARTSTPTSFSWVGCVSADWADHLATRTTLSFLARLKPLTPTSSTARRLRRHGTASSSAANTPPLTRDMQDSNTREDTDKLRQKREALLSSPSSDSFLLSSELYSPRPSAHAPQPHVRHVSQKNSVMRGRAEDTSPSPLDGHTSASSGSASEATGSGAGQAAEGKSTSTGAPPMTEPAAPQDSSLQSASPAKELAALVASLQLYASTLEVEVRRLRGRLACYAAAEASAPPNDESTMTTSTADQPLRLQREGWFFPAGPTPTANADNFSPPPSLPPLVESAATHLRSDQDFPATLQPKLDALLRRVAEAQCAVPPHPGLASPTTASAHRNAHHLEELQLKVALYEHRLALVDYYVTPTLTRCADEIDQCLQPRIEK
ncbi:hypothetical protein ABB37_02618 [Leptomonas pyrrhocoris]|uniref:Uncharacterized protein n=1 Tax=Leptomonas pyrrhocoris TaxID=157538 RepID=A0A0M9G5N5_LEPPY|nr:hypothetical protein ABB37_02618 [Leptomonas pyrrhocoris]XP_015661282.1 hypothetical protein ABB37_02618 [Leptomonas pyrrhocoris]KPA82842.1 hypothetical protein ABB37_02618 [Leptomonas pyrrhocoris]KPA82843.1 hypothetical protein ABB37_02618 [Leptomonas pyrrhocoris]|eukprot:XP_015661281.1 hypothetical protein ABB37_02618 [Leptomonas pyrrhocoris]